MLFAVPRVVGWLAHWRQVHMHDGYFTLSAISDRLDDTDDASTRRCQDLATSPGRACGSHDPRQTLTCAACH